MYGDAEYGDDEDARADAEKESGRSGTPEAAAVDGGPPVAVADVDRGELLAATDGAEAAPAPLRSQGFGGETMVSDKVAVCHMHMYFDQSLGSSSSSTLAAAIPCTVV